MSIYMTAVQGGINTLGLMAGGGNAETEAARTSAYNNQAARIASAGARAAAEKNISAITQDKIISDVNLRLKQSQAEAMKTLQSAFAGVEGGSVEDGTYVIQSEAENLIAANNSRSQQSVEAQLALVNQSHAAMLSVNDTEESTFGKVLGSLGGFELSDLKMAKDTSDGGISKLWT